MTKTITANIPARKNGKTEYKALVAQFAQDESGVWTGNMGFGERKMLEEDVIDVCRKASNWSEIRAEHFPMYGFHS